MKTILVQLLLPLSAVLQAPETRDSGTHSTTKTNISKFRAFGYYKLGTYIYPNSKYIPFFLFLNKELVIFVMFKVIGFISCLLFDPTEQFAKFTDKHSFS